LRFHALAVPELGEAEGEEYSHYHTEEQAGDYPEGRFELALQTAAEAGDQRELDRLFARRSQAETLRLALYLLAAAVVVGLIAALINPPQPPKRNVDKPPAPKQSGPGVASLDLPPPDQYPSLTVEERQRLTRQLGELAEQIGALPEGLKARQVMLAAGGGPGLGRLNAAFLLRADVTAFLAGPEALLDGIDQRLGTPDASRDPGLLRDHGPLPRRMRVLLWKHGVAAYNDPRLNPVELLERLQALHVPEKRN
jgi:hypothetical protein